MQPSRARKSSTMRMNAWSCDTSLSRYAPSNNRWLMAVEEALEGVGEGSGSREGMSARVLESDHWRSSMKITRGWSCEAVAAMNLMNTCVNLNFQINNFF